MRSKIFNIYSIFLSLILFCTHESLAKERLDRAERLQHKINYRFQNPTYIDQVFSHPGVCPENKLPFGRLEFRGDATLNFAITQSLLEAFPQQGEGWLTTTRAVFVSNENNARIAEQLQLLTFCTINPAHNISGEGLKKIKADTCEALIGAIYEDGGQKSAEKFILTYWKVPGTSVQKPTPVAAASSKSAGSDASKKLDDYRRIHGLPVHEYKYLTEQAPFQVQLYYGTKAFTDVFSGDTKSAAKKLAAERAVQILLENNFLEQCRGKSTATILTLLHHLSSKPAAQAPQLGAQPKAVTSSSASTGSVILASLPSVISHKKSKGSLPELCQKLHLGTPAYVLLSGPAATEKAATVTITGFGSHKASGEKAQKLAAQQMYHKMTGQTVGLKKAKEALLRVCQERKLGVPQYAATNGEYKAKVNVGSYTQEAISSKSQKHAEQLAAKKLYDTLRPRLS